MPLILRLKNWLYYKQYGFPHPNAVIWAFSKTPKVSEKIVNVALSYVLLETPESIARRNKLTVERVRQMLLKFVRVCQK